MAHDRGHVRERLRVADQRGIGRAERGEQPALVRRLVGGAGEGVVALDQLEERLFLAEQVLLRTAHDCHAHLAEREAVSLETLIERALEKLLHGGDV